MYLFAAITLLITPYCNNNGPQNFLKLLAQPKAIMVDFVWVTFCMDNPLKKF